MRNQKNREGGISFLGMLTIAFICMKLLDCIDWSWWLVLLPLYGPFVFAMLAIIFISIFD